MAEKDNSRSSVDDIEEQIRKLEKEKEELERRNERQRLEERLQLLQGDVSSLKSGASTSLAQSARDNQNLGENQARGGRSSGGLTSTLSEDAHTHRRSQQQGVLSTSSDDADDLDDVMSASHKQALRINRDILVENMTPDDIFNDLISKHILTNSDVSRIKEKNTIEAINEELLNVLIRRSDKAFHVFVSSLRRTLQGWLANRLDPGFQPKNKRKRRTGEINVNVDCERVVPVRNRRFTCTCQEVEEQILFMAKGAFAHIRRRDASPAAFEQFKKELQQTNQVIKESMEIRNTLKELCRHGDLVDLSEGSVCFTLRCRSLTSCKELWDVYHSGRLSAILQRKLVTPFLLRTCGASKIHLCLRISRLEFLTCALELAYMERKELLLAAKSDRRTPIKKRLRKQPKLSKTCDTISDERNRQAFQEIANNESDIDSSTVTGGSFTSLKEDAGLTKVYPFTTSMPSFPLGSAKLLQENLQLTSFTSLREKSHWSETAADLFHIKTNQFKPCPYNLRYRIFQS